jgi:hypothetical protein
MGSDVKPTASPQSECLTHACNHIMFGPNYLPQLSSCSTETWMRCFLARHLTHGRSLMRMSCSRRMLNPGDRIILGLAEGNPTPKAILADVRVANGLYAADRPTSWAVEITVASSLLPTDQ